MQMKNNHTSNTEELQTERLKKEWQRISDGFRAAVKYLDCHVDDVLQTANVIAVAECALAAVSDWSFVRVLSPVANELAEMTVYGYAEYLDQARAMILEGKDIPDVLQHFDMKLYDMKNGRK